MLHAALEHTYRTRFEREYHRAPQREAKILSRFLGDHCDELYAYIRRDMDRPPIPPALVCESRHPAGEHVPR